MIPVTENTVVAVAALMYNAVYNQDLDSGWVPDPDSGWVPWDNASAPGYKIQFIEWGRRLIQVIQEQPDASDETLIATAKSRVDIKSVGHSWDSIFMHQGKTGDVYSTISKETLTVLSDVRSFLDNPLLFPECRFIEKDPAFKAYLDTAI